MGDIVCRQPTNWLDRVSIDFNVDPNSRIWIPQVEAGLVDVNSDNSLGKCAETLLGIRIGLANQRGNFIKDRRFRGVTIGLYNESSDTGGATVGLVNSALLATGATIGIWNKNLIASGGMLVGVVNSGGSLGMGVHVGIVNSADSVAGANIALWNRADWLSRGAYLAVVNASEHQMEGISLGVVNYNSGPISGYNFGVVNVAGAVGTCVLSPVGIQAGVVNFLLGTDSGNYWQGEGAQLGLLVNAMPTDNPVQQVALVNYNPNCAPALLSGEYCFMSGL